MSCNTLNCSSLLMSIGWSLGSSNSGLVKQSTMRKHDTVGTATDQPVKGEAGNPYDREEKST
eukprot:5585885-Amphidinium_carterae.1